MKSINQQPFCFSRAAAFRFSVIKQSRGAEPIYFNSPIFNFIKQVLAGLSSADIDSSSRTPHRLAVSKLKITWFWKQPPSFLSCRKVVCCVENIDYFYRIPTLSLILFPMQQQGKTSENLVTVRDFLDTQPSLVSQLFEGNIPTHLPSLKDVQFQRLSTLIENLLDLKKYQQLQSGSSHNSILKNIKNHIEKFQAQRGQEMITETLCSDLLLSVVANQPSLKVSFKNSAKPAQKKQLTVQQNPGQQKIEKNETPTQETKEKALTSRQSTVRQLTSGKSESKSEPVPAPLQQTLEETISQYRKLLQGIQTQRERQIWQSVIEDLGRHRKQLLKQMSSFETVEQQVKKVQERFVWVFYQVCKKKFIPTDNVSFESIKKKLEFMNLARFIQFCHEFKLFEKSITKQQAQGLFKKHSFEKYINASQFLSIIKDLSKKKGSQEFNSEAFLNLSKSIGFFDNNQFNQLLKSMGIDSPDKKPNFIKKKKSPEKKVKAQRQLSLIDELKIQQLKIIKQKPQRISQQKTQRARVSQNLVSHTAKMRQKINSSVHQNSRYKNQQQPGKSARLTLKDAKPKPYDISLLIGDQQDQFMEKLKARNEVVQKTLRRADELKQEQQRVLKQMK